MANLTAISDALKLIDSKKENFKKAFDDLQGHSHLLSSFSLTWSDLDSHFTAIQDSLNHRFHALESLESQVAQNQSEQREAWASLQPKTENQSEPDDGAGPVSPRPELRRFCEQMDATGLGSYINDLPKDRGSVRNELPAALKCATDQEALVMDAMEGFFNASSDSKDCLKLASVRRSCILLLESLMDNCPNAAGHVRERAKKLALELKPCIVSKGGVDALDALVLLHLVAAYGLTSEFKTDELLDYFTVIARYRQATRLCKVIHLGDREADLVQRLLSKGKQLLAVKFIFEFELADKFPPVPILKDFVKESKKAAKTVSKEGKSSLRSLNEAAAKEVGALKSVIRYIEDYKLDSVYPLESLEKRIEQLEKQKANRKRPAGAPVTAKQKQPQQPHPQQVKQRTKRQKLLLKKQMLQQVPINYPHMAGPVGSAALPHFIAGGNPTYPPYQQTHLPSAGMIPDFAAPAPYQQSHLQSAGLLPNHPVSYSQSHLQPTGLLPDHPAPYESSSAMAYGMAGPSAEYHGLAGSHMGFPANATAANSHIYRPETYVPSGYYDGSSGYGGYGAGVPTLYHPSYYPQ